MQKTILHVAGMSCEHCVKSITKAIGALPGISDVWVDLKSKTVTVEHDSAKTSFDDIKREIEDQGYDVVA